MTPGAPSPSGQPERWRVVLNHPADPSGFVWEGWARDAAAAEHKAHLSFEWDTGLDARQAGTLIVQRDAS